MNRFFDFSRRQLLFIAALSCLFVVAAAILLINTYSVAQSPPPTLTIHLGNEDATYSGIFVLDPNLAPADSLELLPGIGKVLADRIVEYRRHNRFETTIDLTNVKGIGPKMYERLKPYIKIGQQ